MSIERKTSKTDFMRYLDSHPPYNDARYNSIRSHSKKWGCYLRWKYRDNFDQLYDNWWVVHPETWDQAYNDNETTT